AQADQTAADQAKANLQQAGVTLDDKGNPTNPNLTPAQQQAYSQWLAAQAKVNADLAAAQKYQAQLNNYASNPQQYGNIAQNAVDNVNGILQNVIFPDANGVPSYVQLNDPTQTDPQQAQKNLAAANQDANYANAALAAANDLVNLNNAQQQFDDAQ